MNKKLFILALIIGLSGTAWSQYGGDGLGNHKAIKDLNMNGHGMSGVQSITFPDGSVQVSSPGASDVSGLANKYDTQVSTTSLDLLSKARAYSQQKANHFKMSTEQICGNLRPKTMMLGDSILSQYYDFKDVYSSYTHCVSSNWAGTGANTSGIYKQMVDGVPGYQPQLVILEAGLNDIAAGFIDKNIYISTYSKILDYLESTDTVKAVVVLRMTPWTLGTDEQSARIDEWNDALELLASTYTKTIVLDPGAEMGAPRASGPPYNKWNMLPVYNSDGIHLSFTGGHKYCRIVTDAVINTNALNSRDLIDTLQYGATDYAGAVDVQNSTHTLGLQLFNVPAVTGTALGNTYIASTEGTFINTKTYAVLWVKPVVNAQEVRLKMCVWGHTGTEQLKACLYLNAWGPPTGGGRPAARVVGSSPTVMTVLSTTKPTKDSEWLYGTAIPGVTLQAETTYWFVLTTDNDVHFAYDTGASEVRYKDKNTDGWAAFPSPDAGGFSNPQAWTVSAYIQCDEVVDEHVATVNSKFNEIAITSTTETTERITTDNLIAEATTYTQQQLTNNVGQPVLATSTPTFRNVEISSPIYAVQQWLLNQSSVTDTDSTKFDIMCGTSVVLGNFFGVANDINGNPNRLVVRKSRYYSLGFNGCLVDTTASASTIYMAIFIDGAQVSSTKKQYFSVQDKLEGVVCAYSGFISEDSYIEIGLSSDTGDVYAPCSGTLTVSLIP